MNFKVSERLLGQQVVDMCDLIDEKILENTSERTIIEQGLWKLMKVCCLIGVGIGVVFTLTLVLYYILLKGVIFL